MAEHDTIDGHAGPTLQIYFVIFGALCVFTAVSFIVNAAFPAHSQTGMAIIMGVAICKATLVCMYFMHLKYEWSKLYFLIVPVVVLGIMMMIVLLPDGVLTWPTEAAPPTPASTENH